MVCVWHRIFFAGENGTDQDFHCAEQHFRTMKLNLIFTNNAKTKEMTDHNHSLT